MLVGHPDDAEWGAAIDEIERVLRNLRAGLNLSVDRLKHRRGEYATVGMGISYGGGQTIPANFEHSDPSISKLLEETRSNWAIKKLVDFTDGELGFMLSLLSMLRGLQTG